MSAVEPAQSTAATVDPFVARCLSIDLEVGVRDGRIHRLAAVRGANGESFVHAGGRLQEALARLDRFAAGAGLPLGHNLIAFDAPHLQAAAPDLALLRLPRIDTLRLSPLAFPRNPYHHLVKHYHDGGLRRGQRNDPELDARIALHLLGEELRALHALARDDADLALIWHGLVAGDDSQRGSDALFVALRGAPAPDDATLRGTLARWLDGRGCRVQAQAIAAQAQPSRWPLAYALAWLSVAGGDSVMPPWVVHQFPEAGNIVRALRDTACGDPGCEWCRERHDALRELRRWFVGVDGFRPEPADANGKPLQQSIVESALRGESLLAILPTGTGKSLCYQLPALSRYDKTGALTVVISPLVALMADQVSGLEARGVTCAAALNGLLSMPERNDVLERIRLGDVGILIVSPEQLRSRSFRDALAQREVGVWVIDEAHCVSKWGHDFRPDYRYIGRFIAERAGDKAPLLCLTATAKPDVVTDIVGHFSERLGRELRVFDGGAARANLVFSVVPSNAATKFAHVRQVLAQGLPADGRGGAIVYCRSRARTEQLAEYLREGREGEAGFAAAHFHAGLPPDTKKATQGAFIKGELRVIVATNAFGMGIDKPDVRLVVHADVPGSLENYLQEAGRAGRDRAEARCVLLYDAGDVERQFSLSARSRLTQREIGTILRSLRRLDRRDRLGGEVVATAGEILLADTDREFARDSATDDTRVRTAIAWLEEAKLLSREENAVQVFPSSLRVASLDAARARLAAAKLQPGYAAQLLAIVERLFDASPDEGVSTDTLMGVSRLGPEGVRRALSDLERLGLASNDLVLTAFVHAGVERSSPKRLQSACALEAALIDALRSAAPDLETDAPALLDLRRLTQALKNDGHPDALPDLVWRLVRSLAADGRSESGGRASFELRRLDAETLSLRPQREWRAIARTAELRRAAAARVLDHLLARLGAGTRGTDLLVQTTLGALLAAIRDDLDLASRVRDADRLLDHALLWLHEQQVVQVNRGLSVFRPAMTIRLAGDKRGFARADFMPLALHYDELVVQIHVMAEYAQRGLARMGDALRLAMDYFTLARADFLRRWLPGREMELARQTTPESWRAIVESLADPVQQGIVADEREQTNVLVLAGPGSGKTRVLVHRIAYLVRVRREPAAGILALAYNRHAAIEIRRRLRALVGDDANGVTVLTCHALAMRLAGISADGARGDDADAFFRDAMVRAAELLEGSGLPPDEADAQRDRLLAGFRWILVDEYQDIGAAEYRLIAALAGRTLADAERRLGLFAVGDDDQNIYAWKGSSVEYIRRFEADYAAVPVLMLENYRSSAHIVDAANRVIAPARERMKAGQPIVVDRGRRKMPAGGVWAAIDPLAQGSVQLLAPARDEVEQAVEALDELQRLASLDAQWDWSRCAVIAREWRTLEPVRAGCEQRGIAAQWADESLPPLWRLRETRLLVQRLRSSVAGSVEADALLGWIAQQPRPDGAWWSLLSEAVADHALESGGAALPAEHFIDWLADWGREARRRQRGLLLLSAHRAKGLEFDHGVLLDGGWESRDAGEDADAPRRLRYVAMTRARHTLALAQLERSRGSLLALLREAPGVLVRARREREPAPAAWRRRYRRAGLADVDLGFAGRASSEQVAARIASVHTGDALALRRADDRWDLLDARGEVVGRMARAFAIDDGYECVAASVTAIIERRRGDGDPEYQSLVNRERWEVVLPEMVFERSR